MCIRDRISVDLETTFRYFPSLSAYLRVYCILLQYSPWRKRKIISLLATGLKLCRFFLYLPNNEKTPGDTSLEVTAPCGASGICFSRIFRGDKALGQNVSNRSGTAFNYLKNDVLFINLASKLRRKSMMLEGYVNFGDFPYFGIIIANNCHGGIFEKILRIKVVEDNIIFEMVYRYLSLDPMRKLQTRFLRVKSTSQA